MLTLKLKRNKPGLHTCAVYTLGIVTLLCGIVSTLGTFYFQFFYNDSSDVPGADHCDL